jgi:hypothetical protein
MPAPRIILTALLILLVTGCSSARKPTNPNASRVVFIVVGVAGAVGYQELVNALENDPRQVELVRWGSPVLFFNFSNQSIHDAAEKELAGKIDRWQNAHPDGQIDLVGHSAGCGVILGALPRTSRAAVHTVVLLAPSVSPGYDLTAAVNRTDSIYVFHSDRDTTFLDWRTSHFGTYDRVKTKAAGNQGFSGQYPDGKLKQFPYDPSWKALGNDGGHSGTLSGKFARQVIAPLLAQ